MKKIFGKNDSAAIANEVLDEIEAGREERRERALGATVVALSGDLGAGKTTLTQAIARELGIRENVISPTFVIMKSYATSERGFSRLVHIDAYRLGASSELEKLGWVELIADPGNLVLIEWPEKVPEAIPAHARHITLAHKNEDERDISF